MNAEQTQLLDESLLQVLSANRTVFGLDVNILTIQVRPKGFTPGEETMLARLDYLQGKGLVAEVDKKLHRAHRSWKITADGLTYLDEHNL